MSKYAQQAKATKKKRTISQLGLAAVGKPGKTMKRRSKTMAQKEMSKYAQKGRTLLKKKSKPLTPSEKRRMQQMKAKATTARAKASAARMDKRIAEIKKEK